MEIQKFIKEYSDLDFNKIKFDWNGKHGDDLKDPNMDFRMKVCEYVIKDFSIVPDSLILDLYQELSKSSKETWGVYRSYHLFAQEILNRGKTKYLLNYLQGASQSFDTSLASGRIELTNDEKKEILDFVEKQMADITNTENRKYFEFAQQRFAIR
ncbi:hypothetical protein [Lewinella sp. LCG006]|uniref:hypothetical protein n=1 Tax=Lewinella sp. LCG006 TaxID=3231911 RepID=UPI003460316B